MHGSDASGSLACPLPSIMTRGNPTARRDFTRSRGASACGCGGLALSRRADRTWKQASIPAKLCAMSELPVACTLSPADLARRRDSLLPGLVARAERVEPLPEGARWRFAPSPEFFVAVAKVIDAERRCCPFLRFDLVVEPGGGPVAHRDGTARDGRLPCRPAATVTPKRRRR